MHRMTESPRTSPASLRRSTAWTSVLGPRRSTRDLVLGSGVLALAAFAGCALPADEGVVAPGDEPSRSDQGFELTPVPRGNSACLDAALRNWRLACIQQGLGVGGPSSTADQRTAVEGCGCTAEMIEDSTVFKDPETGAGIPRVGLSCPGDPPFYGVMSPPGFGNPPFIGLHVNPEDGAQSLMCDVAVDDQGPRDRPRQENCASCHGPNLEIKWEPAGLAPALDAEGFLGEAP